MTDLKFTTAGEQPQAEQAQEPRFRASDLSGIGTPIGLGVERPKLSIGEAADLIASTLVRLRLYLPSQELVDVIGEQVKLYDAARVADEQPGDSEVVIGYSFDLDPDPYKLTRDNALQCLVDAGDAVNPVWSQLWGQIPDLELNRRQRDEQLLKPKREVQGRVVGWLLGGDHRTEESLHLTNRTVAEQQEAADAKIAAYQAAGRNRTALILPALGDLIFVHAAALETQAYAGIALGAGYASNLVQHTPRRVEGEGGGMCVPAIYRDDQGFGPGGAALEHDPHSNTGVQFLVAQKK